MAKKPGPKKGSKQRPRSAAQKKGAATRKTTPKKDTARKRPADAAQKKTEQSASARMVPLVRSRGVRNALAATLVSAAGALLFWKRRDKSSDQRPPQEERTGRSSMPASGETDPLVAAGVAGRVGKKRSASDAPNPRRRKAAPVTEPASAEPSEPPQAPPGAYPDGSQAGDTVGRTSVEGGMDRTE